MIIRLARNSGFCFGVKRAIQLALTAAKGDQDIVTLGPLIHNPQMVQKLHEKGIEVVETIDQIGNRRAIIRSHGIPLTDKVQLEEAGHIIIDATCPYVAKTQMIGKQLSEEGYPVLILGNAEHPEVIALRSYVKGIAYVVSEASEFQEEGGAKIGVISQTTQNIEKLENLIKSLPSRYTEVRVFNTICNATDIRQQSTRLLAQDSDIVIVIGGKNSSNTKMLARISSEYAETHHIEIPEEIDQDWFRNRERIGLTAGASTPDWLIIEIYNRIIELVGEKNLANNVEDIPVYKEENHVSK
jgi:4-hydroxy-3-methylbut-2-en-1-yl diphosphate reductase